MQIMETKPNKNVFLALKVIMVQLMHQWDLQSAVSFICFVYKMLPFITFYYYIYIQIFHVKNIQNKKRIN